MAHGFHIGPIGALHIAPPCVLAPMEGITDRSFRRMIRGLGGCGLTVTEFVSSEAMTRDVRRAWQMAEVDADEHPVSIQIYGRDPERMARAARCCEELGADCVDINLGCPSKKVTSGCSGAALMREPELASTIFDAVCAALGVPFSVKMRLGWDDGSRNAPEIARRAEAAGAGMLVVHGRTRSQLYRGSADWRAIGAVKRAVGIPVVANGDILTVAGARRALAESGADGVMVGRGVLRNPWLLRQIAESLDGATTPFEPSFDDRRRILFEYFDRMAAESGGNRRWTMGRIKKVATYFTAGLPHGARLRCAIHRSQSLDQARAIVERYFALLAAHRLRDAFCELHDEEAELPVARAAQRQVAAARPRPR